MKYMKHRCVVDPVGSFLRGQFYRIVLMNSLGTSLGKGSFSLGEKIEAEAIAINLSFRIKSWPPAGKLLKKYKNIPNGHKIHFKILFFHTPFSRKFSHSAQ